jgi:hypothetical protein
MINWRHLIIELPICAMVCALADRFLPLDVLLKVAVAILAGALLFIRLSKIWRVENNGRS